MKSILPSFLVKCIFTYSLTTRTYSFFNPSLSSSVLLYVSASSSSSDATSFSLLWNESTLLEEIKETNNYLAQDIDNFINAIDYAEGIPRVRSLDHPPPNNEMGGDSPTSTYQQHNSGSSFFSVSEDDYVRAAAGNSNPDARPPPPTTSSSSNFLKSGVLRNYSTVNVPSSGEYTNLTIANSRALALSLLLHRIMDSTKEYIEGIVHFILSNINALSGYHHVNENTENMYSTTTGSSSITKQEQSLLLQLLTLKIWPYVTTNLTTIIHSLPIINVPQTACNKWINDVFSLNLPLLAHRTQTGTILSARRMPNIIQKELPSLCSSVWYITMGAKVFRLSLWMILASLNKDITNQHNSVSKYSPRPVSLFPDIYNRSLSSMVPVTTILQTDMSNYNSLQFIPPAPVPYDPLYHSSTGLNSPPSKGSLGYIHGISCIDKEGELRLNICRPIWRSIDSKYPVPTGKDREYDYDAAPVRDAKESGYGNPGGPAWDAAPVIDIPSEGGANDDDDTLEEEL